MAITDFCAREYSTSPKIAGKTIKTFSPVSIVQFDTVFAPSIKPLANRPRKLGHSFNRSDYEKNWLVRNRTINKENVLFMIFGFCC